MNNVRRYIKIAIVSVLSMIVGSVLTMVTLNISNSQSGSASTSSKKTNSDEFEALYETYDTIMDEYYKEVDSSTLIEGAINGMLESLDDEHTMYFNKESKEEFDTELSGSYYGIGAQIQLTSNGSVKIVKIFDDSPAEKAGLKVDDIFVKIDGTSVEGKNATEVANMLKSDEVETATIIIKRNDEEKTFKVKKENISLLTVSSDMLENDGKNVGYLSVSIFGQKTYSQFKEALESLEDKDMDSLIIDLRGNTGGYLYIVTNMLEEFIDKGDVLYQIQSSDGTKKYTSSKETNRNYKVVILVDNDSASASEIMAAAMKELYGATIVGKTTYGKGTVQVTKDLSTGGMIKYTTEKWLTPNGNSIDKEGITPDYEVDLDESYTNDPTYENDAQLQKALELLK